MLPFPMVSKHIWGKYSLTLGYKSNLGYTPPQNYKVVCTKVIYFRMVYNKDLVHKLSWFSHF